MKLSPGLLYFARGFTPAVELLTSRAFVFCCELDKSFLRLDLSTFCNWIVTGQGGLYHKDVPEMFNI